LAEVPAVLEPIVLCRPDLIGGDESAPDEGLDQDFLFRA
jgi:hypothetical protein